MSDVQTTVPVKDNTDVVDGAVKDDTILTGEVEGTKPSSAEGATPTLPHAWMNGLTTEQKADADLIKAVSKFEKGIPDLVGSYVSLEKKQSQAVSVPNEQATEEEKARYLKAIGVPEKTEDYKLEKVELPEGLTIDEAMQKEFLQTAHTIGLNDTQVNAIHKWYMNTIGEQIVSTQKVVKTTKAETELSLRKELGADYDSAQVYMERSFRQFASPPVAALFARTGIGNDPEIIKMFVKIGKATSDHTFVDGSRGEHLEAGTVGQRSDEEIANVVYPAGENGQ